MEMNRDPTYEYEGVDEDDVFYAEIRRQILILTADDDDYEEDNRETRVYQQPKQDQTEQLATSLLRYSMEAISAHGSEIRQTLSQLGLRISGQIAMELECSSLTSSSNPEDSIGQEG